MISCQEAREMLSPYIDGQLFERERRRVQNHLESCETCRDEMTRMLALEKDLRELHGSSDPGYEQMESLAQGFFDRFDLETARAQWTRPRAWRRIAHVPRIPSRWVPVLRIAFVTAVLAGVVFAVRQAGRLTNVPPEAYEQVPAIPEPTRMDVTAPRAHVDEPMVKAARPEPELPSVAALHPPEDVQGTVAAHGGEKHAESVIDGPRPEVLIAFFTGVLGEADAQPERADPSHRPAPTEKSVAARERPHDDVAGTIVEHPGSDHHPEQQEEGDEMMQLLILEGREDDPSLPDAVWAQMWRAAARSLADQAIDTSHKDDCLRALRAYWRISHRSGRILQHGIEERAAEYEQELSRLERLVQCASGQSGDIR